MRARGSRTAPKNRIVCHNDIYLPEREMTEDASENNSQPLRDADGARVQPLEERESIKAS